jgi:hypothetical protein
MFIVPMGIWVGTPNLSVGLYIWKGVIPALLGNIIGGGLFVGSYIYYQFLQGEEAPTIDGLPYESSPVGPMDFRNRKVDLGRKVLGHEEDSIEASGSSTPMKKPESV